MLKKTLYFLIFCMVLSVCSAFASPDLKTPNLPDILQLKDQYLKDKELVAYLKFISKFPVDSFAVNQVRMHQNFVKYGYENTTAFDYYLESVYEHKRGNNTAAEKDIIKANELLSKDNHYLLYIFLSNLAFIQTEEGNAIAAISSFRAAKKQAILLNDGYSQLVVAINISDIYYRYGFYIQSLYYLNQADLIIVGRNVNQPRIKNTICYNKCENFFRMGIVDSLKKYNNVLKHSTDHSPSLYTYIKRTDYYILLLSNNYKTTIDQIRMLRSDTLYRFNDIDRQNLADAWFNEGNLDSSKYVLQQLLTEKAQNNHPEIKYHLYEVLGEIAEKQNDQVQAADNFRLALQQSKENVSKLVQVGDISSQMKLDEMESYYAQQEEINKNQSLWLKLLVVVAILVIAVIGMFYRNTKQKRHYEKLLFEAKKEELAYINSHDIRRHLTNILGIIDVVQHSENKEKEYLQAEEYLFRSAEELDKAIKNIAEKLDN